MSVILNVAGCDVHSADEVEQWIEDCARVEMTQQKLKEMILDQCKVHGEPEELSFSADFFKQHFWLNFMPRFLGAVVRMDPRLSSDSVGIKFKEKA